MFLDYTVHSINNPTIVLPGSKSESNRALILAQFLNGIEIINLSTADDTIVLQKALQNNSGTVDIGHAGTAMRFLTAYYAVSESSDVILTGSSRMQERPIKPLVDALKHLGTDISYLDKEGYPPLKIKGQKLTKNVLSIHANISSQYISALMLVAPFLEHGLSIQLIGKITSLPYLNMTVALMQSLGISTKFSDNKIIITPFDNNQMIHKQMTIESDWSAASYHYSALALSPIGTSLSLKYFKEDSLQGDQELKHIYKSFGIETTYISEDTIQLTKTAESQVSEITLDLNNTPDLAQTIAVTCLGLGINAHFSGLHTLKIKETDRLMALKIEMEKLGAEVHISDDTLTLCIPKKLNKNIHINTFNDHRMAMAFTSLSIKTPIYIENPKVVSKSYPEFWENWKKMFK